MRSADWMEKNGAGWEVAGRTIRSPVWIRKETDPRTRSSYSAVNLFQLLCSGSFPPAAGFFFRNTNLLLVTVRTTTRVMLMRVMLIIELAFMLQQQVRADSCSSLRPDSLQRLQCQFCSPH